MNTEKKQLNILFKLFDYNLYTNMHPSTDYYQEFNQTLISIYYMILTINRHINDPRLSRIIKDVRLDDKNTCTTIYKNFQIVISDETSCPMSIKLLCETLSKQFTNDSITPISKHIEGICPKFKENLKFHWQYVLFVAFYWFLQKLIEYIVVIIRKHNSRTYQMNKIKLKNLYFTLPIEDTVSVSYFVSRYISNRQIKRKAVPDTERKTIQLIYRIQNDRQVESNDYQKYNKQKLVCTEHALCNPKNKPELVDFLRLTHFIKIRYGVDFIKQIDNLDADYFVYDTATIYSDNCKGIISLSDSLMLNIPLHQLIQIVRFYKNAYKSYCNYENILFNIYSNKCYHYFYKIRRIRYCVQNTSDFYIKRGAYTSKVEYSVYINALCYILTNKLKAYISAKNDAFTYISDNLSSLERCLFIGDTENDQYSLLKQDFSFDEYMLNSKSKDLSSNSIASIKACSSQAKTMIKSIFPTLYYTNKKCDLKDLLIAFEVILKANNKQLTPLNQKQYHTKKLANLLNEQYINVKSILLLK